MRVWLLQRYYCSFWLARENRVSMEVSCVIRDVNQSALTELSSPSGPKFVLKEAQSLVESDGSHTKSGKVCLREIIRIGNQSTVVLPSVVKVQ